MTKSERTKLKRTWVTKLKQTLGCAVCGIGVPEALQFHHLEDHVREKSISRLLSNSAGLPKIIVEIEKCSCLCSNHHLMLHSVATQIYPDAPAAHIERIYRQQHQPHYEALALLITQELKDYAKTTTTNPSGGIT